MRKIILTEFVNAGIILQSKGVNDKIMDIYREKDKTYA